MGNNNRSCNLQLNISPAGASMLLVSALIITTKQAYSSQIPTADQSGSLDSYGMTKTQV